MAPATKKATKPVVGQKAAKPTSKFIIDVSRPVGDKIFDLNDFQKYLHDRLKVDGRPGQLGDKVKIDKEGDAKLAVTTTIPVSKRYLKYLSKKFLKKNKMREWLRVVATSKNTYEIRYFNIVDEDEEES